MALAHNIWMKRLAMVLMLMAVGAGKPETRPATQPTIASLSSAKADAIDAARNRFRSTSEYQKLKSQATILERALADARNHGTPDGRLAASHNFVIVDQQLKKEEANAIASDAGVQVASASLDSAIQSRDRLIAEAKQQRAAIADVIKNHKVLKGMTEEEAAQSIMSDRAIGRSFFRSHAEHGDGSRTVKWEAIESSGYPGGGAVVVRAVTVQIVDDRIVDVDDEDHRMQ